MKQKKVESKLVYFLLGGISIIFFGILFASTITTSTDMAVEFEDEVSLTNSNSNFIIGKITVENQGFLPKRVQLPNYVICDETNQRISSNYVNSQGSNDPFSNTYNEYIEVASNSQEEAFIQVYYYKFAPDKELVNQTHTFYVYREDTKSYGVEACLTRKTTDAIKSISVLQQ